MVETKKSSRHIFIRVYDKTGEYLAEVEVERDESIMHALRKARWVLLPGDTIKIVEETD